MARWLVELQGHEFDLGYLAETFQAGDVSIKEQDGNYDLYASDFEDLDDTDAVRARAAELLQIVNGSAKLASPGFQSVNIRCVVWEDSGTRRRHHTVTLSLRASAVLAVSATDEARMGESSDVMSGNEPVSRPTHLAQKWLDLARNDEAVAKVLRLLDRELDWSNLYRICEVIEKDVGGTAAIDKRGWAAKEDIGRFTATANHPELSGDDSRHGYMKRHPKKDAMTLQEARSLITSIATQWLNDKCS